MLRICHFTHKQIKKTTLPDAKQQKAHHSNQFNEETK